MRTILAVLLAVAFLATAPNINANELETPPEVPEWFDTFTLGDIPVDHDPFVYQYCTSADSVIVTSLPSMQENAYCTTGSHTPNIYSISHGPDLATMSASGFTGVVQSIIQTDISERRWSCTFSGGTWTGCSGAGTWPGSAMEFCWDVWAYDATGAAVGSLLSGFATGCPWGDLEIGGMHLSSNTDPNGSGIPSAAWSARMIHG